jgi:dTDP-4-dehydrorhamnose 3,5-epimerase
MDVVVRNGEIEGVKLIEPAAFVDDRGFFFESYHKRNLAAQGVEIDFVQDNHSRSTAGVLRGLHYQNNTTPQWRLVRCTVGEIFDVIVDLRMGSPTLGQWMGVRLSSEKRNQLLIPPEFAHGFCVLSPIAEVQYKCSNHHNANAERAMSYNDPDIGIEWPIKDPILSVKDRERAASFKSYLKDPCFSYTGSAKAGLATVR